VTTGGSREDYAATDGDEHEIGTFLSPLRQTARLCGMEFLPPSVLHKANHIAADGAQAPILALFLRGDCAGDRFAAHV
jgi:glutathione-regulated potassium-efflux system ancillary protein KefG